MDTLYEFFEKLMIILKQLFSLKNTSGPDLNLIEWVLLLFVWLYFWFKLLLKVFSIILVLVYFFHFF